MLENTIDRAAARTAQANGRYDDSTHAAPQVRTMGARYLVPYVALLLLVSALGFRSLDADGVWFDEWWSLYNAGASVFTTPLSPIDIWNRVVDQDPWQTPGYPWLLAAWGNTTGWTEFSARAFSLVVGLLGIAVTFRLGHALSGDRFVGLASAVALGVSTWFIFYVHEMRVYTLVVLLTALVVLLYWQLITKARLRWYDYALFTLATAALLYTHYFAGMVVAALGLWHVSRLFTTRPILRFTRQWWLIVLCFIVAALTLVPLLAPLLEATESTIVDERVVASFERLFFVGVNALFSFSGTSTALFAFVAYFALRRYTRARTIALLVAFIVVSSLVAYRILYLGELRYLAALMPLLALIAGFGAAALRDQRVPPALLFALWIVPAVALDRDVRLGMTIQDTYPQPLREMARALEPHLSDDDLVINHLGGGAVAALQGHPFHHYFGALPGREAIIEMTTNRIVSNFERRIDEEIGGVNHIWLAYGSNWVSPEWGLLKYLLGERGFYECVTVAIEPQMELYGYGRIDPAVEPLRFGENGAIEVRQIGPTTVVVGDMLQIWLGFNSEIPPETYSAGLHITDASGALVAQMDQGMPSPGQGCRLYEIPVAALPAGEYTANVVIYDWRTGARLPATDAGGTTADFLPLTTLTRP